jgi:hypothetical protein
MYFLFSEKCICDLILLIYSDAISLLDSMLPITFFTIFQTVSRYVRIPVKRLLKSLHLPDCMHETTQEWLDRFS